MVVFREEVEVGRGGKVRGGVCGGGVVRGERVGEFSEGGVFGGGVVKGDEGEVEGERGFFRGGEVGGERRVGRGGEVGGEERGKGYVIGGVCKEGEGRVCGCIGGVGKKEGEVCKEGELVESWVDRGDKVKGGGVVGWGEEVSEGGKVNKEVCEVGKV